MKPFIFITFILSTIVVFAQENKERSWFIGLGKPYFPNNFNSSENSISFSLGFKKELSDSFSLETLYTYAKADDLPDFYNNSEVLDQYLLNGGVLGFTDWCNIQNHFIGAGIHFSFVNNEKWFFSFKLNGGMVYSKSNTFFVSEFSYDPVTAEILWYKSEKLHEQLTTFYFEPGFQTHYSIYKDYFIGMDLGMYQEVTNKLRRNDSYNFNGQVILGKKF